MKVVIPTEGSYNKTIREFLRYGGANERAAKKAAEIEVKLRTGFDIQSMTTDHGESRIKNCVKYDLGNGFRLVTVQQGKVVVFLHIGDHDNTQRWLDKNTGLEAVVDQRDWRVEFTVPHSEPPWRVRQTQTHAITPSNIPFLQRVSGVDWQVLIPSKAMRAFLLKFAEDGDDQELLEILEELSGDHPREANLCLTVVNHLKEGELGAAQAAVDVYLGNATPASESLPLTEDVFRAEPNQGRFVILNDLDDAALERFYDPLRFQEWMLCLHAGQNRVVVEDYPGPVLLTGVSGSGKTCVLVHRARRLAERSNGERVLILTMNQTLARLLQNLVQRLCLSGEERRIDVRSVQEYLTEVLSHLECESFLRQLGDFTGMAAEVDSFLTRTPRAERLQIFRAVSERDQMQAFEDFLSEPGNPIKADFDRLEVFVYSQDQKLDLRRYLFDELELVRSAFTCYDKYAGYLGYNRYGRCIPFQENRRNAILGILREWERFQLRRGFLDHMGLTQATLFAADESGAIPDAFRYRWVLVDEFQDISTLGLDLIRRVPTAEANGLFLTGDFAQKIYARDLDLAAAKLDRTRRTDRVIRRNYRNTRQILRAAFALIEKYPPQIGSEEAEISVLEPEYAHRESAVPIATQAATPIEAAWHYARQWLAAGNVPFSVCIATANPQVISVRDILKAKPKGIEADELTGDYFLNTQRVVVSDILSVKGFEFSLIIVCGLDAGDFPPKGAPVAEHWREAMRLYVAITRGRDEVRFVFRAWPSPFLIAMGDHVQFQKYDAPPETETVIEPATRSGVVRAEPVLPEGAATEPVAGQTHGNEPLRAAELLHSIDDPTAQGVPTKEPGVPIGEDLQDQAVCERGATNIPAAPPEEPFVEAVGSKHVTDTTPSKERDLQRSESLPEKAPTLCDRLGTSIPSAQSKAASVAGIIRLPGRAEPDQPSPSSGRLGQIGPGGSGLVSDSDDPMDEFLKRHTPTVLNGLLIVPVPSGASERQLTRALGKSQVEVALQCQSQGHFVPPNRPLPDHIIHGVCEYFRCIANIVHSPFAGRTRAPTDSHFGS